MHIINVIMAILAAIIASAYLVRFLRFAVPLPLVQVALGVVISAVFEKGMTLNPDVFFLLLLPPLLFLDGWRIPKRDLLRHKAVVIELALGLVVFTVVGMGFLIHWLIPSIPLAVAFALAAIVSPTDPVAVSAIASRVPFPKQLMHILEGESLLNDASGLVCFQFAVAAALTGAFSPGQAFLTFIWLAVVGIGIGVVLALIVGFGLRWLGRRFGDESGSHILVSLLIPFAAYLCAEHAHASGILAAVGAGVTISYVELRNSADAITRIQSESVWNTVQFTLNGAMFVLLGEQLPTIVNGVLAPEGSGASIEPWSLILYAVLINLGLVILRLVWVWVSLRVTVIKAKWRGRSFACPSWKVVLAASLAGVRGAVTLAGVMTLPLAMADGTAFPARELTVFLASAVILVSLITASLFLPLLLKDLELPKTIGEQLEIDRATRAASLAAIGAVENALQKHVSKDAEIYAYSAARIIEEYRVLTKDDVKDRSEPEQIEITAAFEKELRIIALQAERAAIFKLARRSRISDETSRRLVRQLDLQESRYV